MAAIKSKQERVYLISLVSSAIILIFIILYLWNNCPKCDETFSKNRNKPIIIYKIG